jgi:hypothetical protein
MKAALEVSSEESLEETLESASAPPALGASFAGSHGYVTDQETNRNRGSAHLDR